MNVKSILQGGLYKDYSRIENPKHVRINKSADIQLIVTGLEKFSLMKSTMKSLVEECRISSLKTLF